MIFSYQTNPSYEHMTHAKRQGIIPTCNLPNDIIALYETLAKSKDAMVVFLPRIQFSHGDIFGSKEVDGLNL